MTCCARFCVYTFLRRALPGRFSLGQVAVPVGVGIGVGTGVPIVTSVVTAVI